MTKRIFRSILLVALAVLLMSFLIILDVLYGYFTKMQIMQLESELLVAAHGVETGGVEWLSGLDANGHRFTLVYPDGTVQYDSQADASAMENHAERAEIAEALRSGAGESERTSATLTDKTFYRAIRLDNGSVLRISVTQNSILTLVLGMLTPVMIVLAAAVVLSAFLANRLARRIVKPLNSLDLEHPLDNDAYDELSPLLIRIDQQRREIDRQLKKLARRQDEFSAVTKSMNEGLVLLNEKGEILSINPAAQKLFHAEGDCSGMDFLTVERSRGIEQAILNAQNSGSGEALLSRNGRQVEIDVSPIHADGQVAGAVLLTFDVTEKARSEQLRREFTANVSHELKTPLQSIMGSAELMESGLVKAEDMPRFTGHIRAEAARLVVLIDDIIRLSQLDEGAELHAESVDLSAVASEAAAELTDAAAKKEIQLRVIAESAGMIGVKRLLHEIAYNLIDNAIKYNCEGGNVTVAVSKDAARVILTVSDNGIGIPPEHQTRIFERFYRVDKSHSKATGGTGLGLSIVKHAAKAMRGEIELMSEPGKGTTVRVVFPVEPPLR